MHVTPEERLPREGLALPAPHPLVANYAWTVKTGSLLFVSAHGPFVDGQPAHMGKLGADMTVENG